MTKSSNSCLHRATAGPVPALAVIIYFGNSSGGNSSHGAGGGSGGRDLVSFGNEALSQLQQQMQTVTMYLLCNAIGPPSDCWSLSCRGVKDLGRRFFPAPLSSSSKILYTRSLTCRKSVSRTRGDVNEAMTYRMCTDLVSCPWFTAHELQGAAQHTFSVSCPVRLVVAASLDIRRITAISHQQNR